MHKKFNLGIGLLSGILLLTSISFPQVEFTLCGLYNLNITYPSKGEFNSKLNSEISTWYPEWQAFFSAVLEQRDGMGFGGRIAYNLTPSTGFEVSVEYFTAKTAFIGGLVDDFLGRLESTGFSDWLETENRSGGNIIRYYGNLVFNFPSSSPLTPYATAGLGFTHFRIKQGVGPEIDVRSPFVGERFHLYYINTSALTFNGGLGVKALFSTNLGLRIDARIFICEPSFEQRIGLEVDGNTLFDEMGSFIQSGTHIDTNLNIGLFLKY
ncbi:MAG: outer membrane beta-barrel protein [Acidobacteriota bacterium]